MSGQPNQKISITEAAVAGQKLRQDHASCGATWNFEDWLVIRYEGLRRRFESACGRVTELEGGLTFAQLRAANIARLPQFKNKHGQPAHSEPDGSDWSPAQWLQAVVGELGEYANLRKKFERGDIGPEEFLAEAADELADIQTYLDILAFRLGVNLGDATIDKFNRVSKRVCCDVKL